MKRKVNVLKLFTVMLICASMCFMCACGNTAAGGQSGSSGTQNTTMQQDTKKKVDPELEAFVKSYEDCVDEYIVFLKNYNTADLTMLTKYLTFLEKCSEFASKADEWSEKDLSDTDLLYYTEALTRINKKMLEATSGE